MTSYTAYKIRLTCDRRKVDEWVSYLQANKEEVSQSLAQENVRHEMWFIGEDTEGLYLIGVMDCDDVKHSKEVAQKSELSVDHVHKQFKQCWAEREKLDIDPHVQPSFPGTICLIDAHPCK